jgi:hypothetical protein
MRSILAQKFPMGRLSKQVLQGCLSQYKTGAVQFCTDASIRCGYPLQQRDTLQLGIPEYPHPTLGEIYPGGGKQIDRQPGASSRQAVGSKYQTRPVLPSMRQSSEIVQNGIDSRLRVSAFCQDEKEGAHARAGILRPLPNVWRQRRGALCAAFRRSAYRTTRRAEICRY